MEKKIIKVFGVASLELKPEVTIITLNYSDTFDTHESALSYSKGLHIKIEEIVSNLGFSQYSISQAKCAVTPKNITIFDENHNYIGVKTNGFNLNLVYKVKFQYAEDLVNSFLVALLNISDKIEVSLKHSVEDLRTVQMEVLSNAVVDAKEQAEVIAKSCGFQMVELHSVSKISDSNALSITLPEPKLAGGDSLTLEEKRNSLKRRLLSGEKICIKRNQDLENSDDIYIVQSVDTEWYIKD
jgi:hypothetical protein